MIFERTEWTSPGLFSRITDWGQAEKAPQNEADGSDRQLGPLSQLPLCGSMPSGREFWDQCAREILLSFSPFWPVALGEFTEQYARTRERPPLNCPFSKSAGSTPRRCIECECACPPQSDPRVLSEVSRGRAREDRRDLPTAWPHREARLQSPRMNARFHDEAPPRRHHGGK